jgi:hypothetical protein
LNWGTTHWPCLSNGLDTRYEWAIKTDAGRVPSDNDLTTEDNAKYTDRPWPGQLVDWRSNTCAQQCCLGVSTASIAMVIAGALPQTGSQL